MTILLGYEVRSGARIDIPLQHLAVTGQTQLSGKTTTLEALIARSGLRAVAFVTKRGEQGFSEARVIAPYFRERADWRFVKSLLESQARTRMNFEAAWIVRACKAAKTLADVQRAVQQTMKSSNRSLDQNICEVLNAYLEIVIPQIDRLPYTKQLELQPGINAMNLGGYSAELQALVIRSVLEGVYQHEQNTIVIIPEAWEFIPQKRGSPVKLAAEELIRKGAGLKNFIWLDSQDIAGVDKDILRSVSVWILGVQREANEVRRALAHIPLQSPKPKPSDVMMLSRGEFFVSFERELKKVYVRPAWLNERDAMAIARGTLPKSFAELRRAAQPQRPVESEPVAVKRAKHDSNEGARPVHAGAAAGSDHGAMPAADSSKYPPTPRDAGAPESAAAGVDADQEEAMWKEKYEQAMRRTEILEVRIRDLEHLVSAAKSDAQAGMGELQRLRQQLLDKTRACEQFQKDLNVTPENELESIYRYVIQRILESPPAGVLEALIERPELRFNTREIAARTAAAMLPTEAGVAPADELLQQIYLYVLDRLRNEQPAPRPNDEGIENCGKPYLEGVVDYVTRRLLQSPVPGVLEVLIERPELRIKTKPAVLELDGSTVQGRIAQLITEGFFERGPNGNTVFRELLRRGCRVNVATSYRALQELARLGFLTNEGKGKGFLPVPGTKIQILEEESR